MSSAAPFLTARNLAIIFLAIAAVKFTVRGPLRGFAESRDLAPVYAQSRGWLYGVQPYDGDQVKKILQGTGGSLRKDDTLIYPLSNSVMLAPVSWLSWPAARVVWRGVSLLLLALTLVALVSSLNFRWSEPRTLVLSGMFLGLAGVSTGISLGQPSVPSVALGVLSLCCARGGRNWSAAVLVALSAALKPQIGAPFFLYYLLNRNWRTLFAGLGALGTVHAVGYLRLGIAGQSVLESWQLWAPRVAYVSGQSEGGGLFADANRFNLINLHILLSCFAPDSPIVGKVVLGLGSVVLLSICALIWFRADRENSLVGPSALCVLSLLVAYHYHYDSMMLVVPIAAALVGLQGSNRLWAWGVLAASFPLLLPGPAILLTLTNWGVLPSSVAVSPWWERLAMTHPTWALMGILACLIIGLQQEQKKGSLIASTRLESQTY